MNRKRTIILMVAFVMIVILIIVLLHRERIRHRPAPPQALAPRQQTHGTLKLDTSAPQFPE